MRGDVARGDPVRVAGESDVVRVDVVRGVRGDRGGQWELMLCVI